MKLHLYFVTGFLAMVLLACDSSQQDARSSNLVEGKTNKHIFKDVPTVRLHFGDPGTYEMLLPYLPELPKLYIADTDGSRTDSRMPDLNLVLYETDNPTEIPFFSAIEFSPGRRNDRISYLNKYIENFRDNFSISSLPEQFSPGEKAKDHWLRGFDSADGISQQLPSKGIVIDSIVALQERLGQWLATGDRRDLNVYLYSSRQSLLAETSVNSSRTENNIPVRYHKWLHQDQLPWSIASLERLLARDPTHWRIYARMAEASKVTSIRTRHRLIAKAVNYALLYGEGELMKAELDRLRHIRYDHYAREAPQHLRAAYLALERGEPSLAEQVFYVARKGLRAGYNRVALLADHETYTNSIVNFRLSVHTDVAGRPLLHVMGFGEDDYTEYKLEKEAAIYHAFYNKGYPYYLVLTDLSPRGAAYCDVHFRVAEGLP